MPNAPTLTIDNRTVISVAGTVKTDTGVGDIEICEANSPLNVETGSGNITVFGVEVGLRAETHGGHIEIHDAHGETSVSTGGGNVQILGAGGIELIRQ